MTSNFTSNKYRKEKSPNPSFGKLIRKYRKDSGLTQGELAKKLGYADHTAISHIELGKRDIPRSAVTEFAEILKIDPSILLDALDQDQGQKSSSQSLSEDEQKIIDNYRKLSKEGQTKMIEQIETAVKIDEFRKKVKGRRKVKG